MQQAAFAAARAHYGKSAARLTRDEARQLGRRVRAVAAHAPLAKFALFSAEQASRVAEAIGVFKLSAAENLALFNAAKGEQPAFHRAA